MAEMLTVTPLRIATENIEHTRAQARRWLAGASRGGYWLGRPGPYGVDAQTTVSPEALTAVLRGQQVDGEGRVRRTALLPREQRGVGDRVEGLRHARVKLTAPEWVGERWLASDERGKAAIEGALVEVLGDALTHHTSMGKVITKRGPFGEGTHMTAVSYAAGATVQIGEPGRDGSPPAVVAEAIVFGVRRWDGLWTGPIGPEMAGEAALAMTTAVVADALDRKLRTLALAPASQEEERPPTPFLGPDSLTAHRIALGERRFRTLDAQVEERRPELKSLDQRSLERRHARAAALQPFEHFDARITETADQWRVRRTMLQRAAERGGEEAEQFRTRASALTRKERALEDHPDRLLAEQRPAVVELGALERELKARWGRAVAAEAQRMAESPSAELLERLGPSPERSANGREQWRKLVHRDVAVRMAEAAEHRLGQGDQALERARQALAVDVRQWRVARGMDRPTPEMAGAEVGL